jgi:prepilin signal peptidase PulO-like enzyme (type II secretory pathway)
MNEIIIYAVLILFGLCIGSFAGASVWRLRARQLEQDKKDGELVDNVEYENLKKLTKKTLLTDRSRCLHCSYELKWYDLIPLFSWIFLKGKCRKCNKKIGYFEPLIEISVALLFAASYLLWPYTLDSPINVSMFILWLISGVGLTILFAYDLKWLLLPDSISFSVMAIGLINAILVIINSTDKNGAIMSIVGAMAILSGIYWLLYITSKGKWIGFGDIKLGIGLALMLADWRLAFVALFVANLIGCLMVIPGLVTGKLKRDSHIPFGPLLIIGFVIAKLFSASIITAFNMYLLY